jgi:predicted NAD/FAD-binding protein
MRTIRVDTDRGSVFAEMGFKHFFEDTYPVLRAVHSLLGLQSNPVKVTVVVNPGVTIVAPPHTLGQIWQWIVHFPVARGLLDYRRFLWKDPPLDPSPDGGPTLRQAALDSGMDRKRLEQFFLPLLAANWGSPLADIADNPAHEIREVMWGARKPILELSEANGQYVHALEMAMPELSIKLNTPIQKVERDGEAWCLNGGGPSFSFDHVVIATEAPIATGLLTQIPEAAHVANEVATIRTFPTTTAIHRDASWMPANRRDWSQVNVFFHPTHPYMTEWSGRRLGVDVFRSWIPPDRQPPQDSISVHHFRYVVMRKHHLRVQRAIEEFNGTKGLWLAGMYTRGSDFHESAVRSAIRVADSIAPMAPWLTKLKAAVPAAYWPGVSHSKGD